MNTTITNINFRFDDGYNSPPSRANLSFVMSNGESNLNGNVFITFDEYLAAITDNARMQQLVKQRCMDLLNEEKATETTSK